MHLPDPLLDATPAATLDLHGFGRIEALGAVRNFLSTWSRRSPGRVVHIIAGKGQHSGGRGVLGPTVRQLLKGELAAYVREWSRDIEGGGFLVRLR